jgi:TonB family protein
MDKYRRIYTFAVSLVLTGLITLLTVGSCKYTNGEQSTGREIPHDTIVFEKSNTGGNGIIVSLEAVDDPPLFDGKPATQTFTDYVINNFIWTQRMDGMSGRIVVEFIIETDGSVSNSKVIRSLDPTPDAEALRIINSSSFKWTPAKQHGKAVRTKYVHSVLLRLTRGDEQ